MGDFCISDTYLNNEWDRGYSNYLHAVAVTNRRDYKDWEAGYLFYDEQSFKTDGIALKTPQQVLEKLENFSQNLSFQNRYGKNNILDTIEHLKVCQSNIITDEETLKLLQNFGIFTKENYDIAVDDADDLCEYGLAKHLYKLCEFHNGKDDASDLVMFGYYEG